MATHNHASFSEAWLGLLSVEFLDIFVIFFIKRLQSTIPKSILFLLPYSQTSFFVTMAGILSKAAGKLERGPAEAARALMDVVFFTMVVAITFSYAERLGKWLLLDFPIAIFYAVVDKGKKTVAIECGERSDCVQLNDLKILDLRELKRCLTLTMCFSEECNLSPAILFDCKLSSEDVLKREKTARIKKPAFSVIRDKISESLVVFIRGTCSFNDILTDINAIAAPVSFKHVNCSSNNVVSGHAHRGMLAAARWIEEQCTPVLNDALRQHPKFKIKIVGHSLGGGTAALLTYMLREKEEFSSCTCVTFGPAACMTLELAEFGKPFITSIIYGSDMVPTLSVSSFLDFISEGRIKRKKFLNATRSTIQSCLPFVYCSSVVEDHVVTRGTQEKEAGTIRDITEEEINDQVVDTEEGVGTVTTLDNLDTHLYPPGRIMHIVPASSSENSNSNHNDHDSKRVYLYETPTQLYGKLRLSRGMIVDHLTSKYLKVLEQLINQQEKYRSSNMVDDEPKSNKWHDIGYQLARGALKLRISLLVLIIMFIVLSYVWLLAKKVALSSQEFQVHASPSF